MFRENWESVMGYEGYYSVDYLGNIKRECGATKGKILKPCLDKRTGYYLVTLCKDTKRSTYLVHKVVARAFIGERPEGYEINHKDTDKSNNRADNLEYLSKEEHTKHTMKMGLCPSGDKHHAIAKPETLLRGDFHPLTKIPDCDLHKIFEYRKLGYTMKNIGNIFGVTKNNISLILKAKSRIPISTKLKDYYDRTRSCK